MTNDELREGATHALATMALTKAEQALRDIDSHEDLCAERYAHIRTSIVDVKETIGTVLKVLAGGLSLLFTVLIGLVAFFGSRTFDNSDAEVRALRDQIAHMQKAKAPIHEAVVRY